MEMASCKGVKNLTSGREKNGNFRQRGESMRG